MKTVNNAVYETLGDRWYSATDDPIALLRAEARARNPWVKEKLGASPCRVLDIGCGGGFLSNELALAGHSVVGMDQAQGALDVARAADATGKVEYVLGDAHALRFQDGAFDAVCAMDVLEHVEPWQSVVTEASRVLRPGGVFLFYTFNRNFLSWLLAVKGVGWVVRNTPKDLHVYRLFIRPGELALGCAQAGLELESLDGFGPKIFSAAFLKLLFSGRVPAEFEFGLAPHTLLGYLGSAKKL